MRKLIVHLFALDYVCRVFGKTIRFVRPANVIFPLMCLAGSTVAISDSYIYETTLGLVLIPILLIAIFFGFMYFQVFGYAKWEEMTESQKYQYGLALFSMPQHEPLTVEQNMEWLELSTKHNDIFLEKRFYNLIPFLVNPIVFIATLIYLFIYL